MDPTLSKALKFNCETFRLSLERLSVKMYYLYSSFFSFMLLDSEIGGAISEFYEQSTPKMQDYDLNIIADIVGSAVVIGTQLNVQDLSKERHFLRYRNTVTIKVRFVMAMRVLTE